MIKQALRAIAVGQRGQTLVELVIALALLAGSVTSAGVLATVASHNGIEAGHRSAATALATRELEALRTYRDNSLRAGVPWATIFPASGSYIVQPCAACTNIGWQLAAAGPATVDYTSADVPGAQPSAFTGFSRLITIQDTAESSGTDPYIKSVEVKVNWTESNGTRTLVMHSILSNWKLQ